MQRVLINVRLLGICVARAACESHMRSICELRRKPSDVRLVGICVAYACVPFEGPRAQPWSRICEAYAIVCPPRVHARIPGVAYASHMRVCPRGSTRAACESHMRSICELRRKPSDVRLVRICVAYACVPPEGPRAQPVNRICEAYASYEETHGSRPTYAPQVLKARFQQAPRTDVYDRLKAGFWNIHRVCAWG